MSFYLQFLPLKKHLPVFKQKVVDGAEIVLNKRLMQSPRPRQFVNQSGIQSPPDIFSVFLFLKRIY